MNKSEEAVKYIIDVWDEVTGKEWRKKPDHVQQKFLAAEKPSELEKYKMETYPKGTTKEEWEQYEKNVLEHENDMIIKEAHFSFVISSLKKNVDILTSAWRDDPIGMAVMFEKKMQNELDMSKHCDRPNKPGYYIANND